MVDVPVLAVEGVQKSYGGVVVLHPTTFSVAAGHVTALAGENGAGKSTVLKIISGQVRPDQGLVSVSGVPLTSSDPKSARRLGVAIVPQELAPYPDLTVYENIFVGREIHTRLGLLDRAAMTKQAREMLEVFELDIDPRWPMSRLSVALTQIVEIAKATTWGAKVLLLDEPTSAIPDHEVGRLYDVIRHLREQGVAMIYTTHRMAEIQELADSVIVLRDGNLVFESGIEDASEATIVHAMVGRDMDALFPDQAMSTGPVRLQVKDLQLGRTCPCVCMEVKQGEILGIGGLVGAGRTEIMEAMFGVRHSYSGTILLDGTPIRRNHADSSIRAGFSFVPEDRKGAGLVLERSVLDNGSLPHLRSFTIAGWIRTFARRAAVDKATKSVNLKSRGLNQLVGTLSGGNQQKVVVARWLTQDGRVLLLDEPTRGVDVGARGEIYTIIRDLAASGISVVFISSDMTELIGLSHRVLVARAGEIVGELDRDALDRPDAQEQIFRLASGQTLDANEAQAS
ncbi:MAG: sugar ABC transporter ATP-binding protein [Actinobacteria bacterium HGW-Actinobacteria-6]|jgi:ribose transport system ATP-binding protein|nr:MAG: sugar ABC transporter ATP-binding protein [Actinobacteria bacterium HGW-Actinobacteria-6]